MKSYTDIEQSKKLAEILPLESADMIWYGIYRGMDGEHHLLSDEYNEFGLIAINKEFCKTLFRIGDEYVDWLPCWSLSALLNALPQSIHKYIKSESCEKTFHLNLFRSHYYCCSYSFNPSISDSDGNNTLYCVGRDNWVDACYEMIIKLKELNLL